MNYQPLLDALAALVSFWLWPYMLVLTWVVLLFSRETISRWIENLGWNGVIGLVSNIWAAFRGYPIQPLNAPGPVIEGKAESTALVPVTRPVETIRYPGPSRGNESVMGPVVTSLDPTSIPRNDTGLVVVGDPAMRSSGEAP